MDDKELQEFWEWCGFRLAEGRWILPDYKTERDSDGMPFNMIGELPPLDLNNLFKYAVPKLGKQVSFYYVPARVTVAKVPAWEIELDEEPAGYDEDPALALYQAIQRARRDK